MNIEKQSKEFTEAYILLQSSLRKLEQDKSNPHYRSKYSSLDAIWNACREPLTRLGFAVLQTCFVDGEITFLKTTLLHRSGQSVESVLPVGNFKTTPQALGSAITYAKRYTLMAIVGLGGDPCDDDGNCAEEASKMSEKQCTLIKAQAGDLLGTILTAFNVEKLEDIEASFFDKIINRIKQLKEEKNESKSS